VRVYSDFGWDKLGRLGRSGFYWVSACSNSEKAYLGHLGRTGGVVLNVPRVPTCKRLTWDTSESSVDSSVPTVPSIPSKSQTVRRSIGAALAHSASRFLACGIAVAM
jgi:hypothetical protein